MATQSNAFLNLHSRCIDLITKYLEPIILAERIAIENSLPLPQPDFDSFAAFRLLSHAELEGYFESKAKSALDDLDAEMKSGRIASAKLSALTFLYLQKNQITPCWSSRGLRDDISIRKAERSDLIIFSQEALGYGRQFIKSNNGIKENSLLTLSALMGYFEDELDSVLINELNEFGKGRGDVAHDSWTKDTSTFTSADIEKNSLLTILDLTDQFYEKQIMPGCSNKNLPFFHNLFNKFFK